MADSLTCAPRQKSAPVLWMQAYIAYLVGEFSANRLSLGQETILVTVVVTFRRLWCCRVVLL